jgi:hypothetical protein
VQQTVLRPTPEQKRQQYIGAPLLMALAVLFAYLDTGHHWAGLDFLEEVALGFSAVVFAYIGVVQGLAVFSFVEYDSAALAWRSRLWRHKWSWSDVTHVEMVQTGGRYPADRVRVHRRYGGHVDLPVLIGLKDNWRDPEFGAKSAHLIATWQKFDSA